MFWRVRFWRFHILTAFVSSLRWLRNVPTFPPRRRNSRPAATRGWWGLSTNDYLRFLRFYVSTVSYLTVRQFLIYFDVFLYFDRFTYWRLHIFWRSYQSTVFGGRLVSFAVGHLTVSFPCLWGFVFFRSHLLTTVYCLLSYLFHLISWRFNLLTVSYVDGFVFWRFRLLTVFLCSGDFIIWWWFCLALVWSPWCRV